MVNRYTLECARTWDFLERIGGEHPLFLRTLAKGYRLGALAEGHDEATADAYAAERMANWHALAAERCRKDPLAKGADDIHAKP